MKRICVLPGDGIGPEVIGCAVDILKEVTNELKFVHADIGRAAKEKSGEYLPPDTLGLMRDCDSCLFGAVTSSEDPDYTSPVLMFRKELDLFANLRPVRTIVPRKDREPLNVVIVRENTEGMYTQDEVYDDGGVTTRRRVTENACRRIVKYAIGYAKENDRRRICCVHKANVLRASDGLFLRIFRETMESSGKTLIAEDQLVDSAAMKLVTSPSRFDMIVTLNLYGDILSDVAAGVAGGLGFAPAGNIGPKHSVFEPAHGSAPDLIDKGKANPTAAILSAAMMLRHLGMVGPANRIERAVDEVYGAGILTQDVGGRYSAREFTAHVIAALK